MKTMRDLQLKTISWFVMVCEENVRQVEKWGVQQHTPSEWLMFTTEELGELAEAISTYEYADGTASDVVKEAIQVATLAIKIAEMYSAKSIIDQRENEND